MRALIVEDGHQFARDVAQLLAALGHPPVQCDVAAHGERALQRARQVGEALDLVVVPSRGLEGEHADFLAALRHCAHTALLVVVPADGAPETPDRAARAGVPGYLLENFEGGQLKAVLARAVRRAGLRRGGQSPSPTTEPGELHHHELVNYLPALVLVLDGEQRIVLWNKQIESATGLSRTEMLGKDGSEFRRSGDRLLESQDGRQRLIRWRVTELESQAGAPVTCVLGLDVTGEREMLRRTLQSERLAAVGTLAAGFAHEVRNPLNSASLQLQVLQRRVERGQREPEQLLPVMALIREEIERLEHLANDFLAMAKPHQLHLRPLQLEQFLSDLVATLRSEATASNIAIVTEFAEPVLCVNADPQKLGQVFGNLMRNAFEAMQAGGQLTLRGHFGQGYLVVEVEDTGGGFDEAAPIFDAFYTTKPGGTGLGLSIAHTIVTEHGGTIRAGRGAKGARFVVRLPGGPLDSGFVR